jgi:hypothetical protein
MILSFADCTKGHDCLCINVEDKNNGMFLSWYNPAAGAAQEQTKKFYHFH